MTTTTDLPEWLEPMAATLTHERFTGPEWIFERKHDGIRLLSYRRDALVELYSRNRLLQHIPSVAVAVGHLPAERLILDGEVSWGRPATYHVFDILWLEDRPVTDLPLEERHRLLGSLPLAPPLVRVATLDHPAPWELADQEGWEGVIAKRRGSVYEHRRSRSWLKMKREAGQELVVGGFTDPRGRRVGLGALLVGYYDGDAFVFAGKVGTGFDSKLLLELRAQLDRLEIGQAPFTRAVGLPRLRIHWVRPELVVQVAFTQWTENNKLRHPRLIGVRHDRNARDVVRETP